MAMRNCVNIADCTSNMPARGKALWQPKRLGTSTRAYSLATEMSDLLLKGRGAGQAGIER